MSILPKVQLSRLRDIGFSLWDPIGCGVPADEYDGYLLQVVSRLRRGEPRQAVAAYLQEIETVHIGLDHNATTSQRADATVAAISNYLETLPGGPLKVR